MAGVQDVLNNMQQLNQTVSQQVQSMHLQQLDNANIMNNMIQLMTHFGTTLTATASKSK